MTQNAKSVADAWFSFVTRNLFPLVALAIILYVVSWWLQAIYPEAVGRSVVQAILLSLTEKSADACLVAVFISLSFEYFVQQKHANEERLQQEQIDSQRQALMAEIDGERGARGSCRMQHMQKSIPEGIKI
jgi:hypothetical protein